MKKMKHREKAWLIYSLVIIIGIAFLIMGPIAINYVFFAETRDWKVNLAFSAGDMLLYYGAILGGLVTCFAIITTIHLNNINRKEDQRRLQFERAYAVYHKLPEILARLESAAIHAQYSVHLDENKLIETLDSMKESEGELREQHFVNKTYYNQNIEALLKIIISSSIKCQENVEHFLRDKEAEGVDQTPSRTAMEDGFNELRESITSAKNNIIAEINKFILNNDDMGR
jgi:hypothetical protein